MRKITSWRTESAVIPQCRDSLNVLVTGADKKSGSFHITEFERTFVRELKLLKPDDCILVNSTWFSKTREC